MVEEEAHIEYFEDDPDADSISCSACGAANDNDGLGFTGVTREGAPSDSDVAFLGCEGCGNIYDLNGGKKVGFNAQIIL